MWVKSKKQTFLFKLYAAVRPHLELPCGGLLLFAFPGLLEQSDLGRVLCQLCSLKQNNRRCIYFRVLVKYRWAT